MTKARPFLGVLDLLSLERKKSESRKVIITGSHAPVLAGFLRKETHEYADMQGVFRYEPADEIFDLDLYVIHKGAQPTTLFSCLEHISVLIVSVSLQNVIYEELSPLINARSVEILKLLCLCDPSYDSTQKEKIEIGFRLLCLYSHAFLVCLSTESPKSISIIYEYIRASQDSRKNTGLELNQPEDSYERISQDIGEEVNEDNANEKIKQFFSVENVTGEVPDDVPSANSFLEECKKALETSSEPRGIKRHHSLFSNPIDRKKLSDRYSITENGESSLQSLAESKTKTAANFFQSVLAKKKAS